MQPTIRGLQADGLAARGVLFLGVMWTPRGPRLLEYNVRFGDPETQVLMQLLDEDLPALLLEVAQGRLRRPRLGLRHGCAIAVVLAAEGYPETPRKGDPITLAVPGDITVIHAGTRRARTAPGPPRAGGCWGWWPAPRTWPRPGTRWRRPWSRCAGRACRREGTSASGP